MLESWRTGITGELRSSTRTRGHTVALITSASTSTIGYPVPAIEIEIPREKRLLRVLILRLLPTAVPLSKSINTKFHFFIPSL